MQLHLLPQSDMRHAKSLSHGGSLYRNRRKIKRPLLPGAIHHVVLKSKVAKGRLSLLRRAESVDQILKLWSKKAFVELLDWVNMGHHLHMKVRVRDPRMFQMFLRTVSGLIARKVTGSRKGKPFGPFWEGLAFTRALTSRLEELRLDAYLKANRIEAKHSYRLRSEYLKAHEAWVRALSRVRALRHSRLYVRDIETLLSMTRLEGRKRLLEAALGPPCTL